MSHIEAMKQWREALVKVYDNVSFYDEVRQAIESIDQAIAEADKQEQGEPVAWFREEDEEKIYYATKAWDDCLPLYTTPQPNVTTSDMKQEHVDKTAKQRHEENT